MSGGVLDGHVPGEVQHIPLKLFGVAFVLFGELNFDLANDSAGQAMDALNKKFNYCGLAPDRNAPE